MALTCPVMAFCILLGELDPPAEKLEALEVRGSHKGTREEGARDREKKMKPRKGLSICQTGY